MLNPSQAQQFDFRWAHGAQLSAGNGTAFTVSPYSFRHNLESACKTDAQKKVLRVYMVANAERTVSHLLSEVEVESLFGAVE